MESIILWMLVTNGVAFFLYGLDKRKAKKGARRISAQDEASQIPMGDPFLHLAQWNHRSPFAFLSNVKKRPAKKKSSLQALFILFYFFFFKRIKATAIPPPHRTTAQAPITNQIQIP